MDNNQYKCISRITLTKCPDCVAILPGGGIVVSTYDFVNDETKVGAILLFDKSLSLLDQHECEGILDFKILANTIVACTVGSRVLLLEIQEEKRLHLREARDYTAGFANLKLLYLDCNEASILAGGDAGQVILERDGKIIYSERPHKYSVWCTHLDTQDAQLFYSGSDDACLKQYDMRQATVVYSDGKSHKEGVTHIIQEGESLVTGSFDGKMRFFDRRRFGELVSAVDVGGGIWRVIKRGDSFLVALFQEQVYKKLEIEEGKAKVLEILEGNGSLAYGMDWREKRIVTLSYYDKVVQVFE